MNRLASNGEQVIALVGSAKPYSIPNVEVVAGLFETPDAFRPWLNRAGAVIHAASRSTPGRTAGKPMAELEVTSYLLLPCSKRFKIHLSVNCSTFHLVAPCRVIPE